MDTELARTFLAVVAAGNFVKAADRLFITQSTVSSRIRSLEELLGCRLFLRNKAGATLTPAGRQFQRHALNLLRTVEQARQAVGVPAGFRASLTVGARIGIWEDLLQRWLPRMRESLPDIAIVAEIGFEDDLTMGLVDGHIDIAAMYAPQSRPGLIVEPLLNEELILVQTEPCPRESVLDSRYVHVDWGPEFLARHSARFPESAGAAIKVNIGLLGLQHILKNGGSGYFPRRLVANHLSLGLLHRVPDAPSFTLPAFIVYPSEHDPEVFGPALNLIREIVARV
ncbi:LysR family transcriptional regulator [Elongatibacter sediminis]|uniref:LysR family transcriptional regulator n=1 Tax=Elongatibacter sediminis TaxID=3119006 RepID=A0AAW9R9D0_9GAMM